MSIFTYLPEQNLRKHRRGITVRATKYENEKTINQRARIQNPEEENKKEEKGESKKGDNSREETAK